MLRLFLRLYLFLMLPATVAFVCLMYLTDQVMAQMHAEQQRQRAGVAFDRAERIVLDNRAPAPGRESWRSASNPWNATWLTWKSW